MLYIQLVILLQIRTIDKKQEVPRDGPMCDLLWSDPEGELSMLVHGTQLPLSVVTSIDCVCLTRCCIWLLLSIKSYASVCIYPTPYYILFA